MNCPAARRLLDQGVRPSSSPPERAALGFHLAGCADCRAYRAHMNDRLLSSLLAAEQITPQPAAPAPIVPATKSTPRRTWRASISQALWYGGLGLLATFLLAVVIVILGAALSIFNIHQNVQAMIVPTAGAQASQPTRAPAVSVAPATTVPIEPTQGPSPAPTQ